VRTAAAVPRPAVQNVAFNAPITLRRAPLHLVPSATGDAAASIPGLPVGGGDTFINVACAVLSVPMVIKGVLGQAAPGYLLGRSLGGAAVTPLNTALTGGGVAVVWVYLAIVLALRVRAAVGWAVRCGVVAAGGCALLALCFAPDKLTEPHPHHEHAHTPPQTHLQEANIKGNLGSDTYKRLSLTLLLLPAFIVELHVTCKEAFAAGPLSSNQLIG